MSLISFYFVLGSVTLSARAMHRGFPDAPLIALLTYCLRVEKTLMYPSLQATTSMCSLYSLPALKVIKSLIYLQSNLKIIAGLTILDPSYVPR
jgi:hypothetical protein